MAGDTLKEVIQLVLQTQGREGIDQLRAALASMGDVSADTVADTDRLLDSLAGLNETAAKAARFDQLGAELAATSEQLDAVSRAALQLSLQIGATEKPSKDMLRTFKEVRGEVTRLEGVQRKQAEAQARIGTELREAGFDTKGLADANRRLRTDIDGSTAALQRQVRTVEQEAAATRQHRQAIDDQDAAFRRLVRSGQLSADALEAYRQRTLAAREGTRGLTSEGGRLGSMFSRLRSLAAPVLAFLTFRTAAQGVKNLADAGAQIESMRRALIELYGSQEAGNKAFAASEALAKRNGLAISDTIDLVKQLKAFGIDPLNGSLQAFIDQNASVGGSMEDLKGKILALGQAWSKQKLQGEEILQLVERGVPVWDLLQKATGKNVQELQKLSTAGKLGRDVIQQLYEELGRESAGAANRNLGTLSGLIAQASAKWIEFKQQIVAAGLGDYLKSQLAQLVQSAGGLEPLAKKISDAIVGMLEAIKNLGAEVLPVARSIGDAALFVARHANAVVLLAKAYAALKLAEIARGFTLVAGGARAAAAATAAQAAAAEGATGIMARLGTAIRSIPSLIRMSVVVAGAEAALYFWQRAGEEIQKVTEAQLAWERVQVSARDLQRDQVAMGRQLADVYRDFADVQIKTGDQVRQLTQNQAKDYQFALEQARLYWEGQVRLARAAGDAQKEAAATEHWKALQAAIVAVQGQLQQLSDAAATAQGLRQFVDNAVAKFDELVTKGKNARDAIKGAFDGLDLASSKGLEQAAEILDQVAVRGTAAGRAVQAELRAALAGVADEDLPKVQAAAAAAFDSGSQAAKDFARAVDAINLTRLGVDVDAITTGFSKAGRAAVDQFRAAIDEVDKLGLTAAQRSDAIAQAFDAAFKKASTKTEIEALRKALQTALAEGSIGFQEFTKRILEADAKLADLAGTGANLGSGVKKGVADANAALSDLGSNSTSVAKDVEKVGEASQSSGDKVEGAAQQTQQAGFALLGFGDALVDTLLKLNKWAGSPVWDDLWNSQVAIWRKQKEEFERFNSQLDKQLAKLDPLNRELDELKQKYNFLDDATLRAGAEKLKRIRDEVRQQQDDAKRARDAAQAALDQQNNANIAKAEERQSSSTNAAVPVKAIRIELGGQTATIQGGAADLASLENMLAQIARAKAVSVTRRPGG